MEHIVAEVCLPEILMNCGLELNQTVSLSFSLFSSLSLSLSFFLSFSLSSSYVFLCR